MSLAFEQLAIISNVGDYCKTSTTIFSHFKSKILAAIDEISERKKSSWHWYNIWSFNEIWSLVSWQEPNWKSLFQSCPEILGNLLNINTLIVEIFFADQRRIHVSQTKEDLRIYRNIEISLLGTAPTQMHSKILHTITGTHRFVPEFLKLRSNCLLLKVMWVAKYLPWILE